MDKATSTPDAILEATIEAVSLFGLAKLSMSDVATRANISRPTLYKYFSSKDDIVSAAVAREAAILVDAVLEDASGHDDPVDALEAALVTALRLAREHPLLDRIIRTEPESLLPYLTTDRVDGDGGNGGAAVLLFVRIATETLIRERLDLDDLTSRRLADMVARLLVSYAISAPDDPPEVVAATVSRILLRGALDVRQTQSDSATDHAGSGPGSTNPQSRTSS